MCFLINFNHIFHISYFFIYKEKNNIYLVLGLRVEHVRVEKNYMVRICHVVEYVRIKKRYVGLSFIVYIIFLFVFLKKAEKMVI